MNEKTGVDVLALFDHTIWANKCHGNDSDNEEWIRGRAAIAELLEAAKEAEIALMESVPITPKDPPNALSRLREAIAACTAPATPRERAT